MEFIGKLRALIESLSNAPSPPGTTVVPPRAIAVTVIRPQANAWCVFGGSRHCTNHPDGRCCWCEYRRAGTN